MSLLDKKQNIGGDIAKGDYYRIRRVNNVLKPMINTLSTLFLASNSYTMQLLSAPTRAEVNQAHRPGRVVPFVKRCHL